MSKGHIQKRQRAWQKMGHVVEQTGQGNIAGWHQMADKFREMGWAVQSGGEPLVSV